MIDYIKQKPSPGKLISLRGREWIVLPSEDDDILLVKPLGGSDDEITGIYLPLDAPEDRWEEATFPEPGLDDINDFETAKLLFDASRLSFRHVAGPFRSMGKLSFRPRSYQVVPLVMALKQEVVRLLIADDVGIGKTVEALIILKEMMERAEVRRFAVICLPHLCEQWQQELKDKLDIEAEIIRSSTISSIERKLSGSESVFKQLPYQVISIDYVKSDRRKPIFLNDCPEFIIVDEAHSCARPQGASSIAQQQRYHLLHDIAADQDKHLLLLTATPHSGKDAEFQSLLGLLKPEFLDYDVSMLDQGKRRKMARHFIQRKRESIRKWLKEETPFPERDTVEVGYKLSTDYLDFFHQVQDFARDLTHGAKKQRGAKGKYWAALALLRGVMSSPDAGVEMLKGRMQRKMDELSEEELAAIKENPVIERLEEDSDAVHSELIARAGLSQVELNRLQSMSEQLEQLAQQGKDSKVEAAIKLIKKWIQEGYNPIVFCRFIATANYLGRILRDALPGSIEVQAITSELPDEQRKERIDVMGKTSRRLLIATDCLSEGVNLQDHFNAVMHYDLPWNPNRLEQREGRVDRFGQLAKVVRTALLWGEDNPIDAIVLKVLIRKVKDIQRTTGVSISLGEDNRSIMDAVLNAVLLEPEKAIRATQTRMDFGEDYYDIQLTNELEQAKSRAENLRSIFSQEGIKPQEIEKDLLEVDEAIGDIQSVEQLIIGGIQHLGGQVERDGKGYKAHIQNIPAHLKELLPQVRSVPISFESPTPAGFYYIGRNHRFTEQLCQMLIALAFEQKNGYGRIARASVIQTENVRIKTTVVQFRVRNVIKEVQGKLENISEEMYLWGFEGSSPESQTLDYTTCRKLLFEANSTQQLSLERQQSELINQLTLFEGRRQHFIGLAEGRAKNLVEAHSRFKALLGGRRYEAVYPILPPDILGVYVFIPQPKTNI
jgi:superfamily II DNA or RNA helicase